MKLKCKGIKELYLNDPVVHTVADMLYHEYIIDNDLEYGMASEHAFLRSFEYEILAYAYDIKSKQVDELAIINQKRLCYTENGLEVVGKND